MRPLATFVTLLVLFAGCISEEPPTATSEEDLPGSEETIAEAGAEARADVADAAAPAVAGPRVVSHFTNGTVTGLGAGNGEVVTVCCVTFVATGEGLDGSMAPEGALAGVVLELVWSDPVFDLDLWLYGPDFVQLDAPEVNGTGISTSRGHWWRAVAGQTGLPDRHAKIVVTDAEALALEGSWSWRVGVKSGSATPFSSALTFFYGAAPLDTFSALAQG